MQLQRQHILTILANALLGAAILVFATGFFPHKAFLPGLAQWPNNTQDVATTPPFDKVIFMVVDALRSDFVYGNASNFHFTQSLIRSGAAIPFTGHASPPTITMPRVKAITTGSVPSFLDLLLNFAESDTSSTLASQDSWLAQMKAKPGGKLVMYGDDTWLRLFPGFFDRSDGTTSFFVSDFTEVDLNVTRNVPEELLQEDWSAMILHYLGLDHIGHKTGPKGPNMPAKQREMDNMVEQIYTAIEHNGHLESCLIVLLGDHGMNEGGNHGASSAGEVSTALTFISPKFKSRFDGERSPITDAVDYKYYDIVEQSDIAPTLAALLGFPIPRNSLGVIINRLLTIWPSKTARLQMLFANADQIQQIAAATFMETFSEMEGPNSCLPQQEKSEAEELACQWKHIQHLRMIDEHDYETVETRSNAVNQFLRHAQSLLSGTASKYDLSYMYMAVGLVAIATALSLVAVGASLITGGMGGLSIISVTVIYSATMFASSYVEEEHQFWFWGSSAWLVVQAWKTRRTQTLPRVYSIFGSPTVCLLYGILRRWNQTGQKYAGEPDLVTMIMTRNPILLWTLNFITYAQVTRRLRKKLASTGVRQLAVFPIIVGASAWIFKLAFTAADAPELLQDMKVLQPIVSFATSYSLVSLARVVFLGLAHLTATSLYYEKPWNGPDNKCAFLETFHDIVSLFLMTQTRTVNIPLFLMFDVQASLLRHRQSLEHYELILTSLLMQYSSFFALGGTNAISSVDLSNAYNGVSGYNVLAVGILTFVSNWAGPIWWTSATSCILSKNIRTSTSISAPNYFASLTFYATTSTLAVMVACTILREHLFIWTVFSPKYLYTMAWIFGQHIMVNGVLGSLVLGSV